MAQRRAGERGSPPAVTAGRSIGIPDGAKDLLATSAGGIRRRGARRRYREQRFDFDATVIRKLEECGRCRCAKLAM